MTGELFKTAANLKDLTHVPYKGSAPAITDALGGHVPMIFDSTIAILPQLKERQAASRSPSPAPSARRSCPTCRPSPRPGLKGVESYAWYGFFAPAKTPKDVIAKLNAEAIKVMKGPDFDKVLEETGLGLRRRHAGEFRQVHRRPSTRSGRRWPRTAGATLD